MYVPRGTPYLPRGTLREVLAYPLVTDRFADRGYVEALERMGLGRYVKNLDANQRWDRDLSENEQMALSLARVVLHAPRWVVFDDTFSSLEDETLENQPKNKARVFRIRSLDQMVDEGDRLSRAYAEGDLAKWVRSDSGAPMKVRLLYKQLNSLVRVLRDLAGQQGWEIEE